MVIRFNLNNNDIPIDDDKLYLVDTLALTGKMKMENIYNTIRKMCNVEIEGKRYGGRLKELDLSEAEIAELNRDPRYYVSNLFNDCTTLKKLVLPKDWEIKGDWFSGCIGLEEIIHKGSDEKAEYIIHDNGCVYRQGDTALIKYPAGRSEPLVKIYAGCHDILDSAFENCENLRVLILPSSTVANVTMDAFKGLDINKITIKVPEEVYDSYYLHNVWGKFRIETINKL